MQTTSTDKSLGKPITIPTIKLASTMTGLTLFSLYLAAYYLPFVLDPPIDIASDPRVRLLLSELLRRPAAQLEIGRNILSHLLPLAISFWVISVLSIRLAAKAKTKEWIVRVLLLLATWILMISGNALLFPASDYSYAFVSLTKPLYAYLIALTLTCGFLLIVLPTWKWRHWLAAGSLGLVMWPLTMLSPSALGSDAPSRRNIIIIGVDSLSASAFQKLRPSLPNLEQLLASGTYYERAYTPLGRTFPAWMSILSGQAPATHGAIFNLRSLENVEKEDLISTELHRQGYRTLYAIDERRFNNIDETFGFDQIVGPHAGALDFVLQRLNDTPLSNLLLQTRLGKAGMPFSYANTASHANYDAQGFVDSILAAIDGTKPLFLAVHFESAHYPFKTRHAAHSSSTDNDFLNRYAAAMTVVDKQIGDLLDGLTQKLVLQDALVIVLSDHGEGLGETEATISVNGQVLEISDFGHGGNILSDQQNRIVLGVSRYRNGVPERAKRENRQASLLSVRQLIADYASRGEAELNPVNNCILVETGIRFATAADYRTLNEASLAASSAGFYEIDPQGRLRLRENRLKELVYTKDIGWRCPDRLTWWSAAEKRYFSMKLDEGGQFTTEQIPPLDDVRRIDAYRAQLLASAHR